MLHRESKKICHLDNPKKSSIILRQHNLERFEDYLNNKIEKTNKILKLLLSQTMTTCHVYLINLRLENGIVRNPSKTYKTIQNSKLKIS